MILSMFICNLGLKWADKDLDFIRAYYKSVE